MPSVMERYVQGLLFGEQLKGSQRKRRWEDLRQQVYAEQLEDIRQGRKAKQKLFASLKDPSSGMGRLAPFVEAGESLATAADITGYTSPEERRKIAGDYTQVDPQTITGLGLSLKSFMPQATITPTGTTVPIKGTPLDISEELRRRMPEAEEKKELTETEKKRQRRIKLLMNQGMSRQEAEDYLTQQGMPGKTTEVKPMTWKEVLAQAASLEKQAGQSDSAVEIKGLTAKAKKLRGQANELFRQEQRDRGMVSPTPAINPLLDVTGLIGERSAVSPLSPPALKEPAGMTPEGIPDATQGMKKKIDAGLAGGASREEIQSAIERESEKLIKLGVDIEELYEYLGL